MNEKSLFAATFSPGAEPALGADGRHIQSFRPNAIANAVTRKLVESMTPSTGGRGMSGMTPPAMYVGKVANKTASNINDAENMMQLLPDLTLAKQVLISSILAPADMMSCALTYSLRVDDLGDFGVQALDMIKDFYENTYKIKPMLEPMLDDILFMKGSYPLAILPESAIDEAINSNSRVSMESLSKDITNSGQPTSYGVLGNVGEAKPTKGKAAKYGFGMEQLNFTTRTPYNPVVSALTIGGEELLSVTDNLSVLKWPHLADRLRDQRVRDAYAQVGLGLAGHVGMEGLSNEMAAKSGAVYKPRSFNYMPILSIKTLSELEKENVGHPLVARLPAEAVIPVHVPGSPDQHIGYFVVNDRHGNPIKTTASRDYYSQLNNNNENFREMTSQLLAQTRRASEGQNQQDEYTFEQAQTLYTEIVEQDLKTRLTNGLYGENIEIARPHEIYRIMFARACERMMTQLVFIPTAQFVYMAFDYNDNGVGKSLLEDTKILGSIRAMLLFANTMSAIKNSVNRVKVNIKLDPEDPDPDRTVEYLMHEYAKSRQAAYPIGASNPLDITNFLATAGVQVCTSGHDGYPETEIDLEERQSNHTMVNTDLDEQLRKRQMMAMAVAPETVDQSMNVDFATSVISSNILLAKRGMMYQEKFTPFIVDFMQKFAVNSATLMKRLTDLCHACRDKFKATPLARKTDLELVMYFIQHINVTLPAPNFSRLEMQMKELQQYIEALDVAIPAFISANLFDSSTFGEMGNNIESLTASIKAHFIRRFMQQHNILPELFELTSFSEKEGPAYDVLEQQQKFVTGMSKSLSGYLVKISKTVLDDNAKITEARGDSADDFSGSSSTTDETSTGADGGGSDDEFSFGGDLDIDSDLAASATEEEGEDTTDETKDASAVEETPADTDAKKEKPTP